MAKLIIEITGRIVLGVHAGGAFSREEWQSIVAVARRPDLSDLRCLVYDQGMAVDSAQRRELVEAMAGRMPRAAVLSGSRVSHGITTALGWFQPAIKPFAPDRFEDAADHLGLTPEERETSRKAVRRISTLVGLLRIT